MSIYVVTHKKVDLKLPKFYNMLLVGAYNKEKDYCEYLRDDSKDNISKKNQNFCELTGLYWIWKNTQDSIVGLVHYRRFFYKKWKIGFDNILNEETIKKDLENYDIILPFNSYYEQSLIKQYRNNHYAKDLENVEKIIKENYPEYMNSYNKVMKKNTCHALNMFICNKKLIDEYCEWLFDILFKLENITDISDYDDYQKRIYGFLSERLFNVWIHNKKIKIKIYPVFNHEDENLNTSKMHTYYRYAISFIKFKLFNK